MTVSGYPSVQKTMENSAVQIYLRIRKAQLWETNSPLRSYINYDDSTDQMIVIEKQPYIFDKVFYPQTPQDEIFASVERNVDNLLKGYNSGVFAVGASGSGKTSTIFGLNVDKNQGLITYCLESLFEKIKLLSEDFVSNISVQFIEIYNEKVYDLLGDHTNDIYCKGSTFTGSTKLPIQSSYDAHEILEKANKNRHVRATLNNSLSSRSHAMFSICYSMTSSKTEIASVLHLVDLAGSEGLRTTNHSGIAQQEGVKINQGLLSLSKVIEAYSSGKKLIPYRDSVLTTVLKNCLNRESYITLFACISPAKKDKGLTISTIRFAQKCKNLENKTIPEMNSYLKEQQRHNARTPLKTYMMPLHRNQTEKTPGRALQKTPGANTATSTKSMNRSYISLSTFKKPTSTSRYTDFSKLGNQSHIRKDSVDNTTFSILNASSSTEVEGLTISRSSTFSDINPSASVSAQTFSPLIRQIEATMDRKLAMFMESMRNQTMTQDMATTNKICVDVRNAVMNGLKELESSMEVVDDDETFENAPVSSTIIRQQVSTNKSTRTNRRLTSIELSSPAQLEQSQSSPFIGKPAPKIGTRRSTRISMMHSIVESKSCGHVMKAVEAPKRRHHEIKNQLLEGYLNNSAKSLPKVSRKAHKDAIMDIINTGSMKDLQLLSGIGKKKAFEIVTKRTVKGKFKSLNDLKKALAMTDKSWQKFLEKNTLN